MTDEHKDRMVQAIMAIMAELPDTHCFVLTLAPLGVPDKLGVATVLYSANPPDIPLVLEQMKNVIEHRLAMGDMPPPHL